MSGKIKILLPVLAILLLIAMVAIWFLGNHLPGLGGAENPTPRGITPEALNLDVHKDNIANTETYRSDDFTGSYEVFSRELADDRFELVINEARLDAGELKMELCLDGEVVHTFVSNRLTQKFLLENVTGTVSLRITGQSADFQFEYYIYTFHIQQYSLD